ncbi:cellulose biosynthesis protein BcsQ [Pseudomonas japonica]|uniref:cellulose biosynthesis protein BcsQ n=1 Tax=Pseudomonas japonica TaxID=256466 RepID=UPI0009FDDB52|nr:cellulose biosynthesis protein BcsQ [Pseudomonas japonica]
MKPVAINLVELKRAPAPSPATPAEVVAPAPRARLAEPAAVAVAVPVPVEAPAGSLRDRLQALARERRALAEEHNRRALDRALRTQSAQRPKARVIAVVSAKGGVGKSTLVASLGRLLKRSGGRTVLLDLDPQNALVSHLQVPRASAGINQARLDDGGWSEVCVQTVAGIDCLPFGPSNAADQRDFEAQLVANPAYLMEQLADLDLGKDDLLLIDTASGASPWLHQVLAIADQVLAVTLADAASYIVLDKLQSWLAALRPADCAFLVNQVDARNPLSQDMSEVLRQQLGSQWLAAIPLDHQLGEALAFDYDPFQQTDSPACQALRNVAEALAQRIEQHREETSAS